MAIIELRLSDEDRAVLGGPEWIPLDVDRVMDTPAVMLRRWEAETNYPIELALDKAGAGAPAIVTQTLVWLARKQTGDGNDPDTGMPESFARLNDIKTMRVGVRRAAAAEPEVDAVVPPDEAPQPPEPTPEP